MKTHRGDVVILDYPYSDASGSKVRPALIVQSDRDNARLSSTIVALITKNLQRAAAPTQLVIDVDSPEGKASGLHRTSAVTCNNLFTVHEDYVIQRIGQLSDSQMRQIEGCLKAALDLH